MPVVLFTSTPKLPRDLAHLPYVAGYRKDMTEDEANRWLRRGVARVIAADPPRADPAPLPQVVAVHDPMPTFIEASIDPEAASETDLRRWLVARQIAIPRGTTVARLRELAMEALTT